MKGQGYRLGTELSTLQRGIDRLFENFIEPPWKGEEGDRFMAFVPPADVEEEGNKYLITMDLPGVTENDIRIDLTERQLTVSGERTETKEEGSRKSSYVIERFHGKFERSFTLPANVDAEKVNAQFKDGVLKITVPKGEAVKSRQIRIVH